MLKSYLYLFLFLFLISCSKSYAANPSSPLPSEAYTWEANIDFINFTHDQESKVRDAVDLIKKVIASEAFRSRILNHKYKGKITFVDNRGLTNAQIYQKILDGSERLKPGNNNAMDISLETYYVDANVIGYTLPSINKIYMNRKYFNKFTPIQISSNMIHEWLHKLGFGHDYENTPSRRYSVPYAVGYIMKSLAARHL